MSGRYLLLCAAIGATLGTTMIATHTGPGLLPPVQHSTPEGRNKQRSQMLENLKTALTRYRRDHGRLPVQLAASRTQICSSYGDYCERVRLTDVSFLTTGGDYLPTIPIDPLGGHGSWASGFFIQQLPDGTIKLTAPEAELDQAIELSFTP